MSTITNELSNPQYFPGDVLPLSHLGGQRCVGANHPFGTSGYGNILERGLDGVFVLKRIAFSVYLATGLRKT